MRIATWNVNGLRSAQEEVINFLNNYQVDILCLQEIKVDDKRLPENIRNFDGYRSYWFHAQKPGYSGVAIYTKIKPKNVRRGMNDPLIDKEGRNIELYFDEFVLANFYFPHSGRELGRLDFKIEMNDKFLKYIQKFDNNILICGDLNVAHQEIDLARPKDNRNNAGFTDAERKFIDQLNGIGLVDIYRKLNPDGRDYTWWSQRFRARARDVGWRIDYFLCHREFLTKIKKITVAKEVLGSDHCPVIIDI